MLYPKSTYFYTNHRYELHAIIRLASHSPTVLTEAYIEALLVDEGLADWCGRLGIRARFRIKPRNSPGDK